MRTVRGPGRINAAVTFETLVERSTGAQPWRRLFHAANGLVVAGVLYFTDLPHWVVLGVLAAILAALIALDVIRLLSPRANELFFRTFRHLVTPREAKGPASSTWYVLGLLTTIAIFPRAAAISGILLLALADPAASWVGRRWGRRPFLGATLEGTSVFLAVSLAILLARHSWPVAVLGAVVATLAERFAWPVDDNLVVPVAGAAAVTLLGSVL
jgi:dolichol kinase